VLCDGASDVVEYNRKRQQRTAGPNDQNRDGHPAQAGCFVGVALNARAVAMNEARLKVLCSY